MVKTSIVIPSYGSYHLLDKCLRSVCENTDYENIEIIVVCNGCDTESAEIVINNGFQLYWSKEAIGFTKAANIGLKLAKYPISLLLNTDTLILNSWPKNKWLQEFTKPFDDPLVGVSGISTMNSPWGTYTPFFCTAIRNDLFSQIGYLDEDFNPGYSEDLDFCIRVRNHGYKVVAIDEETVSPETSIVNDKEVVINVSPIPIYHTGEGSFSKQLRDVCLKNAENVLTRKWGKPEQ